MGAKQELLRMKNETFGNFMFPSKIRRDPQFGHHKQLYLVDEIIKQDGKLYVTFQQALEDTTAKDKIGCFTFLRLFSNTPLQIALRGYALDERERLLYLLFGGGSQEIVLKLFHLRYQAPDKFGYRRITAEKGRSVRVKNQLVCPEPPLFALLPPMVHSLAICPATGRLLTGYMVGGLDNASYRLAVLPADLVYNRQLQKAQLKAVTDRLPFMSALQTAQMRLGSPVFSRSNDLLFWQGVHQRNLPLPGSDESLVIVKSFTPGHAVNGHLNELKIDPVKLVKKSFLPKEQFDNFVAQIPSAMPEHIFFGSHLQLLGHVHKYVVFNFHQNYILAAKWPKEWYKLTELPAACVWKVLHIDKEKWGETEDLCLYGTDLYFKFKFADTQAIRRKHLGHKFKNYHRCAHCGKEETAKKRNKNGQRVSKFKVCRVCKQLNLHLFYSDANLACHYCSQEECQQKHWKQHKVIHTNDAKDRK